MESKIGSGGGIVGLKKLQRWWASGRRIVAGVLSSVVLAIVLPVCASAAVIVGDSTVEATVFGENAGTATAFKYTASASGTLTSLSIYVDSTSTATSLIAGIYSASGSRPGTLLAQASLSSPSKGAWNTVPIPGVAVTSGTAYWIAILGPAGAGNLKSRENPVQNSPSEVSASSTLSTLPEPERHVRGGLAGT